MFDPPGDGRFREGLDLIERAQVAGSSEIADIKSSLAEIKGRRGGLGVERIFVGSCNEQPQLVLHDAEG